MSILYRIAMSNIFTRTIFGESGADTQTVGEWIIVSLFQGPAELIVISDAGLLDLSNIPQNAPDELTPVNSFVGTLERSYDDATSIFLIEREAPEGVEVPGNFFAADGFARVSLNESVTSLQAAGRLDLGSTGFAWQFDAQHVPWKGEVGV